MVAVSGKNSVSDSPDPRIPSCPMAFQPHHGGDGLDIHRLAIGDRAGAHQADVSAGDAGIMQVRAGPILRTSCDDVESDDHRCTCSRNLSRELA